MGLGGISIWQLLIVLAIVLVLFGAKRLRTLGTDLGTAVKGFKSAVKEGEEKGADKDQLEQPGGRTIDGEVTAKEKDKA
jgi:sec-independent protein translocase protein TatA